MVQPLNACLSHLKNAEGMSLSRTPRKFLKDDWNIPRNSSYMILFVVKGFQKKVEQDINSFNVIGKRNIKVEIIMIVMLFYVVMLCCVMLCYVMLCYVMLCYVILLCYVMLCYVLSCYVILLCFVMLCYVKGNREIYGFKICTKK